MQEIHFNCVLSDLTYYFSGLLIAASPDHVTGSHDGTGSECTIDLVNRNTVDTTVGPDRGEETLCFFQ